ncbi:MAG TPA: hypothetical protein VES68_03510 [Candidatus Sulfotelmatobacter sp.]|nr:hypothetical protein [Candidatus Sulfotelmatobacter sp.]
MKDAFPQPGAKNVKIFESVYLDFPTPIILSPEKKLSYSITPSVATKDYFSNENTRLNIAVPGGLGPQTKYKVEVNYGLKSYSWEFETVPASAVSQKDQEKAQGYSDQQFGNQIDSFYKKYPWYDNLPPPNDNYFIGFDGSKNQFFIDLYPSARSSTPVANQVSVLKQVVFRQLQNLGVDTSKFSFSWTVVPK